MMVFASAAAGAVSESAAVRTAAARIVRFMSGLQDGVAGGGLLDAPGLGRPPDLQAMAGGGGERGAGAAVELHGDGLGLAPPDAVPGGSDAAQVPADPRLE